MSATRRTSANGLRRAITAAAGTALSAAAVVALCWLLVQVARWQEAGRNVPPAADDAVILSAPFALIRGEALLVPRGSDSHVGAWKSVDDELEWRFVPPRPGEYEIFVDYACSNEDAGSAVTITAGGREFAAVTRGSSNPAAWKSDRIASVRFDESDAQMLSIRAARIPGESVMKLKQVVLRRLPE